MKVWSVGRLQVWCDDEYCVTAAKLFFWKTWKIQGILKWLGKCKKFGEFV